MKVYLRIITLLFLLLNIIYPDAVHAHPGNTASDGCHYCRTNCAKWGYTTGTRHCHGGTKSVVSPSKPTSTYKPKQTIKPIITKTPQPSLKPSYTPTPSNNSDSPSSDDGSSIFGWLLAGGAGIYGYQWLKGKKNRSS